MLVCYKQKVFILWATIFYIVYSVAIDNSIFVPFGTNAMAEISIFSLQYEGEYPVISFHC